MSDKSIAIIPARGGSKRIPDKNIKEFRGKPIIAYSIEAALRSGCFDAIYVSTDCKKIADVSILYGAEVLKLRPANLSDDFTGVLDVMKYELIGKDCEYACLIYATAPMISFDDIKNAFDILKETSASYVLSVAKYSTPIQRALKISDQKIGAFHPDLIRLRSQDCEPTYYDAAHFCWGKASSFTKKKSLYDGSAIVYEIPNSRVCDIDTVADWVTAERMFDALHN